MAHLKKYWFFYVIGFLALYGIVNYIRFKVLEAKLKKGDTGASSTSTGSTSTGSGSTSTGSSAGSGSTSGGSTSGSGSSTGSLPVSAPPYYGPNVGQWAVGQKIKALSSVNLYNSPNIGSATLEDTFTAGEQIGVITDKVGGMVIVNYLKTNWAGYSYLAKGYIIPSYNCTTFQ